MVPKIFLFPALMLILIWAVGGVYLFSLTPSSSSSVHSDKLPVTDSRNHESCRILALGDSITAGYSLDQKDAYPAKLETRLRDGGYPCSVINAWVSGDTSKGLLDRLDFTLGGSSYSLAILTIGGNDGLRMLPLSELRGNIVRIVKMLREKNIPVVLAGMQIPSNAWAYAKEFKELYPSVAKELSIPLLPFFLEWVAFDPRYNIPDGIHPNAQGYGIIADHMFRFLTEGGYLDKFKE